MTEYITRCFNLQIKQTDIEYRTFDNLMYLSKNLYNVCLYVERQLFFKKRDCEDPVEKEKLRAFMPYEELCKSLQNSNQVDYRALPAKLSQHICKQVTNDYKSFFVKWKNGDHTCRIPHYKHKTKGRNRIAYDYQMFSKREIREGYIKLTGTDIRIKIPDEISQHKIQEVHVTPTRCGVLTLSFIYRMPAPQLKEDNGNYMGIDLGVRNLAAVVYSDGSAPTLYDGNKIKSYNQYYNKKISSLQSETAKKVRKNIPYSRQMKRILKKRNNCISDTLHKVSGDIVETAVNKNVNTIVMGYNSKWKQKPELGGKNNQNFCLIPHHRLIAMIKYKAEEKGINVICHEESYTSKCSFPDNESIEKHESYKGKRAPRGIFTTSWGFRLNSDVNGALNILKKAKPMFNANCIKPGIVGLANPLRKCMQSGVLTFKSKPAGYDYSLAV